MASTVEKQIALNFLFKNDKAIRNMSDIIWRFAEPGLREYKSAKYLSDFLEKNGFKVERGIGDMPTAFLATFGEGKPIIGTYAEYDATSGISQKPVPYKEPVVPYGPGFNDAHNMIGVAAIWGAIAVKTAMERHGLKGTIKLFGTPAEKLCVGKTYQASYGYYDGFDAFVGWHPRPFNSAAWNQSALAYKTVCFSFHGIGESGPTPWHAASALDAAVQMYNLVNFQKEHVLSHGEWFSINEFIMTGGQCTMQIPDFTQLVYCWRSPSLNDQEKIYQMLKKCAQAAATATGTSVDERLISDQRTFNPNHAMARLAFQNMELVGPPRFSEEDKKFVREIQKNLGLEPMKEPFEEKLTPPWELPTQYGGAGDDSNEYSWHAPYARIFVNFMPKVPKGEVTWYPSWVMGALCAKGSCHKMGVVAAKTIALTIIDLLIDPTTLNNAWAEFKERTGKYHEPPLIPKGLKPPVELRWPEWIDNRYPEEPHGNLKWHIPP